MSIPVSLSELRAAIAERGPRAYLLSVSDDARPHAVHVAVWWDGDTLVADAGKRTAANAAARPTVSLLFPVRSDGDYSLIVDGQARVSGTPDAVLLLIAPTKAVLHRPGPSAPGSSCSADCVPVLPSAGRSQR